MSVVAILVLDLLGIRLILFAVPHSTIRKEGQVEKRMLLSTTVTHPHTHQMLNVTEGWKTRQEMVERENSSSLLQPKRI